MRAPYPFVGGRYEVQGDGVSVAFSKDGKEWADMTDVVLDYQLPAEWGPFHEYTLRCRLEGEARLRAVRIVNDVQMAPGHAGDGGENRFAHTDESPGRRQVHHARVGGRPQAAVSARRARLPADGAETEHRHVSAGAAVDRR
jgi:hypothetical protein